MPNERLREALARERWSVPAFAEAVGVDHKTVERWITKERTPHRRIAIAAAARLGEDPVYLWPALGTRMVADETYGEIVKVYPERSAVPNSLWLSLLTHGGTRQPPPRRLSPRQALEIYTHEDREAQRDALGKISDALGGGYLDADEGDDQDTEDEAE